MTWGVRDVGSTLEVHDVGSAWRGECVTWCRRECMTWECMTWGVRDLGDVGSAWRGECVACGVCDVGSV